jgi:hypothetical protein
MLAPRSAVIPTRFVVGGLRVVARAFSVLIGFNWPPCNRLLQDIKQGCLKLVFVCVIVEWDAN